MSEFSVGHVYKYADVNGTLLPQDQWIPATNDTVYDSGSFRHLRMCSFSMCDNSGLGYQAVHNYPCFATTRTRHNRIIRARHEVYPGFCGCVESVTSRGFSSIFFRLANGKESITIEMLLTHTSGFEIDPSPPLWMG